MDEYRVGVLDIYFCRGSSFGKTMGSIVLRRFRFGEYSFRCIVGSLFLEVRCTYCNFSYILERKFTLD